MSKNDNPRRTSISKSSNIEELAEYWDTHSLADHWDETSPADFEVRVERRHRVAIDTNLYAKLEEQARTRGILIETLVNMWLAEHLQNTHQ
ncbi:MAG: CopG family antitoxin [Chloroflexia bacterium]